MQSVVIGIIGKPEVTGADPSINGCHLVQVTGGCHTAILSFILLLFVVWRLWEAWKRSS